MNCQDVQKFSFTYLDGEFDGRERGEFEEHLRLCPTCRAQIARDALFKEMSARHLGEAREQAGAKVCPQALRARVCAGLDAEARRRRSRAIAVPTALAASVGLLMVSWQAIPGDSAPHAPATEPVPPMALRTAAAGGGAPMTPQLPAAAAAAKDAQAAKLAGVSAGGPRAVAGASAPRVAPLGAAAEHATEHATEHAADTDLNRLPTARPTIQLASTGGSAGLANSNADRTDVELSGGKEFGSVRTEECVRNMVRAHNAELPAEITGSPLRVQRYLQSRLPGLGSALPLAQGAGVDLLGARIALVGDHPVVVYRYQAFGVPLTVFSRPRAVADTDERGELRQPGQPRHTGLLLDRSQGLQLLHVVGTERVLTLVSELGAPQMLQLLPSLATM